MKLINQKSKVAFKPPGAIVLLLLEERTPEHLKGDLERSPHREVLYNARSTTQALSYANSIRRLFGVESDITAQQVNEKMHE